MRRYSKLYQNILFCLAPTEYILPLGEVADANRGTGGFGYENTHDWR